MKRINLFTALFVLAALASVLGHAKFGTPSPFGFSRG